MPDVYKALVIGSGAGGAPAAAALAARWGDGVLLVEAGRHNTRTDFTQVEADMVRRLYVAGGQQATEDGAVALLQGRGVGGSTVINDALCFRPPSHTFVHWLNHGVHIDEAALSPYVDEVWARLSVTRMSRAHINKANYLLALGASRLGLEAERLHHNSPGCVQCGFRNHGCAYGVKQSMDLTFAPLALERGAVLRDQTCVHHLERRGGVWEAHTTDGEVLRAERVALAAGAVQTPTLLLRSGIQAGEGFQVHLQTPAFGDFAEPVDGFAGISMAVGILEHADVFGRAGPGYIIEGVNVQPMAFAAWMQGDGEVYEGILRRYRHLAGALMVLRSKTQGRVRLGPGGRPAMDFAVSWAHDANALAHFYAQIHAIWRAAGADRVLLAHRHQQWFTDPPKDLPFGPGRQFLYAAHLFGGACRGHVLDEVGRVKGQDDLWVVDASGFPEALGVNPQVTIAALALQAAERM
ncbi:MAG: GMC family oxidoreductase [Alphaproteobacteria bacterium]|nr:GMC family oxidoreductase [Alphaproteobacteria bacterium]